MLLPNPSLALQAPIDRKVSFSVVIYEQTRTANQGDRFSCLDKDIRRRLATTTAMGHNPCCSSLSKLHPQRIHCRHTFSCDIIITGSRIGNELASP